ncbi:MAG: MerR family transcriptional regulator [Dorea sp.]|nr:MerR family transcriptional regulator [Dorea sp.]
MMTVKEVSDISGVSIRSLHHYDKIGLLPATDVTTAGYRLYDENALERLQLILLFKELQFPLKDIKEILDDPNFNRSKALEQQIRLLEMRKEHLENLIDLARGIKTVGINKVSKMSFEAFDTRKIDEYAAEAKKSWGTTDAWKEYEQKSAGRSKEQEMALGVGMMDIFAEIGKIKDGSPESEEAQNLVKKLQNYITDHFYTCTDEILESLGQMYAGGGDMTKNIDRMGGEGTAAFANEAIEAYILAK